MNLWVLKTGVKASSGHFAEIIICVLWKAGNLYSTWASVGFPRIVTAKCHKNGDSDYFGTDIL